MEFLTDWDDPTVRISPAVFARAQITMLLAKAKLEERKALEEKIAGRLKDLNPGK